MADKKLRVRFAPSPTGELHVGNARTALFNWLYARHHKGALILRIEDTDTARSDVSYQNSLYEDLKWLGLDWDEGPIKGGLYGPYRQSERLQIYDRYLIDLIQKNLVYPCYCTEDELEEERQRLILSKRMPRYMGKCRNLTEEERKEKKRQGREHSFRFKIKPQIIEFDDEIRGMMRFDSESIGDFIIMRSNGMPAYNFAAVIDDHLMNITHVIRGEDHLSNTALQIMLYQAFDFTPPAFAHHSLIFGKDHVKLSKRHGAVTVNEFRRKGFLPEALRNYLGILGVSYPGAKEVLTLEEMIAHFSLAKVSRSGAIFDEDKLRWLNALYVRNSDTCNLMERIKPFIDRAGYDTSALNKESLKQVIDLLKNEMVLLSDISEYWEMFYGERKNIVRRARSLLENANDEIIIKFFIDYLKKNNGDDEKIFQDALKYLKSKTGKKGKELFMPLRIALTGRENGPELNRIFVLLGKDESLKRLCDVLK